jgi:hypothetical protein
MTVQTYTLKKGTFLYRSSIDICKMYKNELKNYKEECPDTGKLGLYFSDSIHIPIGMSLEYLVKYNKMFKNHQIGKFFVEEDITFYVGKYCYREKELGGTGSDDYKQEPKYNYNHTDKISVIHNMSEPIYEIIFGGVYNEYFIGIDSDLDKIKLVEVYDFNIENFKKYVLEEQKNLIKNPFEQKNLIKNLFENLFKKDNTGGIRTIVCEEEEKSRRRKSVKQKSRRKSVKQKSRRRKSVKQKSRRKSVKQKSRRR